LDIKPPFARLAFPRFELAPTKSGSFGNRIMWNELVRPEPSVPVLDPPLVDPVVFWLAPPIVLPWIEFDFSSLAMPDLTPIRTLRPCARAGVESSSATSTASVAMLAFLTRKAWPRGRRAQGDFTVTACGSDGTERKASFDIEIAPWDAVPIASILQARAAIGNL